MPQANRGMNTAPMMKQALSDGMPAGDSPDETSEQTFECPKCHAAYKLVPTQSPDQSQEASEQGANPMSDQDLIDSYANK